MLNVSEKPASERPLMTAPRHTAVQLWTVSYSRQAGVGKSQTHGRSPLSRTISVPANLFLRCW